MSEEKEKKNYAPGKVKISSTEYRGLLEEIASLKRDNERISAESNGHWRRAYDSEQKIRSLEDELKKLTEDNTHFRGFINSSADRKDAFTHYIASLITDKPNEEEDD